MAEALLTARLDTLFDALHARGYRVVGPTIRDGAIVYDQIGAPSELPIGWTDEQAPGHYRLRRREDSRAFGYAVGPNSWKRELFPPRETLVQIQLSGKAPVYDTPSEEGPQLAFLGVRGCELAAIRVLDRVLTGGPFVDGRYRARRDRCLIVAVDCTEPSELCFCSSMGTGPAAQGDYDLHATEWEDRLLLSANTERGRDVLQALPTFPAQDTWVKQADAQVRACGETMTRRLDPHDLPARLMGNLDHPRWDAVAERCISCGNCTSVCPTCFCFDITDRSPLGGGEASRERSWDSCFNPEHSSIHGGRFRPDTRTRYQQWATHKFATWTSQFGTSGCVGCGRCIAWCPVGIDVTEEVNAIAGGPGKRMSLPAPRVHSTAQTDGQPPVAVEVLGVTRQTGDVVTLTLRSPPDYRHGHGQFNMLSIPGVGEVPVSVSGSTADGVEHTIRAVGATTRALCRLQPGEFLGLRGPFGSHWPIESASGRKVVVIAGGIGLAPLRSALLEMEARPADYPSVRLLFGARSPEDVLFSDELLRWVKGRALRAHVTVDRSDGDWAGNVGAVTTLMRRKDTPTDGLYLLCGPEVMMRFVLRELLASGVPDDSIYLSMERNMKCAVGLCGRCQYGPHFVCKDGPVFRYDQIADIFAKPGF